MKFLTALAGLSLICASLAVPLDIPKDNSHYVEGESRYIWMEFGDGVKLVDLHDRSDAGGARRYTPQNEYRLFTRQNPTTKQVLINQDAASIKNSNYRADRGVVFIVHGWGGSGESALNTAITNSFLTVMDVNVIVVDYEEVADYNYFSAAMRIPNVGQQVGNFLEWLITDFGGDWDKVHLVGYSLGAHAVASAGRYVNGKVARITGLDAAGPEWGGNGWFNADRLRSDAARYVEVIHTDGRALGIMDLSGHSDFYPNGGRHTQPGCAWFIIWGFPISTSTTCSHRRAHEYFASTILTPERFIARQCNSLRDAERVACDGPEVTMGNGDFNKHLRGIYALKTKDSWPF